MVIRLRGSPPEAAHQRQGHRNRLATQDVHAALLERGDLIPAGRQCAQRWLVQPFEPFTAVAIELPERALVQLRDELANCLVQFGEAEEAVIAQPGENPALDDLYADFDLGLLASQQLSVMRNVA